MNEADTNNIATELFRQEKGKELWTHLQETLRGPCDTKTENTSKMDDEEKDNKNNAKRRTKATISKVTKHNSENAEMTTVNNASPTKKAEDEKKDLSIENKEMTRKPKFTFLQKSETALPKAKSLLKRTRVEQKEEPALLTAQESTKINVPLLEPPELESPAPKKKTERSSDAVSAKNISSVKDPLIQDAENNPQDNEPVIEEMELEQPPKKRRVEEKSKDYTEEKETVSEKKPHVKSVAFSERRELAARAAEKRAATLTHRGIGDVKRMERMRKLANYNKMENQNARQERLRRAWDKRKIRKFTDQASDGATQTEYLSARQQRLRNTFAKRAHRDAQDKNKSTTLLPQAPTSTMPETTRQQSTASSSTDRPHAPANLHACTWQEHRCGPLLMIPWPTANEGCRFCARRCHNDVNDSRCRAPHCTRTLHLCGPSLHDTSLTGCVNCGRRCHRSNADPRCEFYQRDRGKLQ